MDGGAPLRARPWLAVGSEIARSLEAIDPTAFENVLAEFADVSRRWFFTGQGRSGLVASMAAMRMMHLGRPTHVLGEATAPSVRDGDGLLVVSGSGATPISLRFAGIAKDEGARVVALTGRGDGGLARLADVSLTIPAEGSDQLGGSLFEQVTLLVLDAVALALAADLPDAAGVFHRRHTNML
jgi:6-phospho-3-hexuloisomerase